MWANIKNNLLLLKYYFQISKILKSRNISKIQQFNFQKWHHGYAYFTGEYKDKKVFIKIDTKLHLLQNDMLVYDVCQHSLKDELANIIDYITEGNMQIIIYEFLRGEELSEELLIKAPSLINQIFNLLVEINKVKIIHRDIKLDNFFVINNKIKIIDFTFANSFLDKNKFKELDTNIRNNCVILDIMCIGLKPNNFEWNDFYSMKIIIKKIFENENYEIEPNTKNMLRKYIQKFEKYEINNTYKIDCNSKYYFWKKKLKLRKLLGDIMP